jgi:hypothetical protein
VPSLSISSILSFPQVYPLAVYVSSSHSGYFYPFIYLPFIKVFQKAVPKQNVANPLSLPPFFCRYDIPVLLDSKWYFFVFHTIGPSDLLNPSPAPHFKTFQAFLIHFPQCPNFSTLQSYAPNVALYRFLP